MASDRKQLNVRLSESGHARLERLMVSVPAALNIQVSQADVVEAAFAALEEKYPLQSEKGRRKKSQESA
jgi:hypothetical protein